MSMTPTSAETLEGAYAICQDCAEKHGAKAPDGHLATWWVDDKGCDVCGRQVACCAISDWNWPSARKLEAEREL